jgi:hypothetical protein
VPSLGTPIKIPIFGTPITIPMGPTFGSPVVGDFNGDGRPDLAVNTNSGAQVLLNTGYGDFTPLPAISGTSVSGSAADFNGDGRPDLVGSNISTGHVVLMLNSGGGQFANPVDLGMAGVPGPAADFNGDGKPDIPVFASSNGTAVLSVLLNNGNGTFTPRTVFTETGAISAVGVADFNRDGKADLVIADGGIAVLLGNGDGSFAAPIRDAAAHTTTLAVGDFNGDARPDLVVWEEGWGSNALFGNGDGSFAAPVYIPVGSTAPLGGKTSFVVGDFSGDGKQDIAIGWFDHVSPSTTYAYVQPVLSIGDGSFGTYEPQSWLGINGNYSLAVGDFNGDGRPDIAAADGFEASTVTLLMNLSPTAASTIATVDLSGLTWYLRSSNSPGAPDTPPFPYGGPGWKPVVGDWNGDGQATVGAFDPATATWYLRNSNSPGAPDIPPFSYGLPGWIPMVGDWSGTGHTGIGVFDPSTATWYLRNSDSPGAPDFAPFQYGLPGWVPVVGDWNGGGATTIGVIDPATMTWYLRDFNDAGAPDFALFAYGLPNWQVVVGDWTNSGHTGIGVVDPNGFWYIRSSASAGAPDVAPFPYGLGTWTAVAGAWGTLPMQAFGAPSLSKSPDVSSLSAQELAGAVVAALGPASATWVGPIEASRLSSATSRDSSQLSGPIAEWLPLSSRRIDALDQVFAGLASG